MKIFLSAILILLAGAAAFAADTPPMGPVKIHADNVSYFSSENKSTLKGNVVAVSDTYTLTADSMDVYFNDQNEILRLVTRNNVNFKSTDILAVANYAEVDQTIKTIFLSGNSKIWQKENYIEGEKMRIQYETKEIYVDKGTGDRVTVIFTPGDNQSKP